jgi:hypothetical protein
MIRAALVLPAVVHLGKQGAAVTAPWMDSLATPPSPTHPQASRGGFDHQRWYKRAVLWSVFSQVSAEDAIEGMAYYIALYLSRAPEARYMEPKQLQAALRQTMTVSMVCRNRILMWAMLCYGCVVQVFCW